jgi:hypothetical protein
LHYFANVETPAFHYFENRSQHGANINNKYLAESIINFSPSAENVKDNVLDVVNINFPIVQAGICFGDLS